MLQHREQLGDGPVALDDGPIVPGVRRKVRIREGDPAKRGPAQDIGVFATYFQVQ